MNARSSTPDPRRSACAPRLSGVARDDRLEELSHQLWALTATLSGYGASEGFFSFHQMVQEGVLCAVADLARQIKDLCDRTEPLQVELRSAADSFRVDALTARTVEASAIRLTAEGAATLADLLNRAAAALETTTTTPGSADHVHHLHA